VRVFERLSTELADVSFRRSNDALHSETNSTWIVQVAWALLCIAGVLEIAFAVSMKSSDGFTRLVPALLTICTGITSVILLSLSLRELPVGTGYAVWTGIGAAGTATLGIIAFGESAAPMRIACIALILASIIGLKLISKN
jgi:quaternary ammonium compound-resistance protein SugE